MEKPQALPIDVNLNHHAKHAVVAVAAVIIWMSFTTLIKSFIKDS